MQMNNKRKSDDGGVSFAKRGKHDDFKKGSGGNRNGTPGQGGKNNATPWKSQNNDRSGFQKNHQIKKGEKQSGKKKQLSTIVTEAKANYQLYSDKKIDKSEKQLLMSSTYDLVKDHIPELARMKGMGKIIGSLIDKNKKQQLLHVISFYESVESKLLLSKGNGYRLAIKIIQNSNQKVVQQYVDACLSNGKGLRALMENFKSARVLCAVYACGNVAAKKNILSKLALGSMPLSGTENSLNDIFSNCKGDVVDGCKTFLTSILNAKSLQHDLIQDMILLCIESHKSTGMEVEEFVKLASENVLPLCRRITNCTLPLWIVWLSNAQMRKHIMKGLKGKIVSLLQTYNGRMFMMALFESTDDTKALNKMITKEIVDSLDDLVQNTEVRKLLEFLLLPRSTKFLHPKDIEILRKGDEVRTSKKSDEARFDEIRDFIQEPIITAFKQSCSSWLMDNKMCLFIIAIVDRFGVAFDRDILEKLSKTLTSSEFAERFHDKAVRMVMESLVNADVARYEFNEQASSFIDLSIPMLDKQSSDLITKSPRIACMLHDGAIKIQKSLTFKWKKSWIQDKKTQEAIKKCKNQKKP